ncbi:MAG: alanine racemase [Armatimonadetes bacterium]|nr:alanine racemase [Armatimonadota bacterium]
MRPAWIEVDLARFRANVEYFQGVVGPECQVCAVVKGNAYGHGLLPIAREAVAAGCPVLAVALADEAAQLRQAGIEVPILILGESAPEEAEEIVALRVTPAVATAQMARALDAAAQKAGRPAEVHIKIDSGMGRQGIRWDEVEGLAEVVAGLEHVRVTGLFTHFAVAESDAEFTRWQFDNFLAAAEKIEHYLGPVSFRHACNTAATLLYPEMRLSMVRLGAGWAGLNPGMGEKYPSDLKPILSLHAKVALVKTLHAGDSAGYGRTWKAPGTRRIALLPLGYADGYKRTLSNNAEVLIKGRRVPIIGRISMDAALVDVTEVPGVEIGEMAVLLGAQDGEEIRVEELAERAGTIVQDIATSLGPRLPRVYRGGMEQAGT